MTDQDPGHPEKPTARPAMPHAITRTDAGLEMEWSAGEPVELLPARALRLACPCASCREEMTGRPLLDPTTVPEDVVPQSIELVGGYGLRIRWSDGHGTGIYTFEVLRRWPGTSRRGGA